MSTNIILNEFSYGHNLKIIYLKFEIQREEASTIQFESGLIPKLFIAMQTVDFVFISCLNTFMTFILIYESCCNQTLKQIFCSILKKKPL